MKVYVVFSVKNGVEEVIGVRETPKEANKLLDGRYGHFCEYDTSVKTSTRQVEEAVSNLTANDRKSFDEILKK